MAYTIQLPTKTYQSFNKQFTVTQERQSTSGKTKTRFSVSAPGSNFSATSDWLAEPANIAQEILKIAPKIESNLPLIETDERQSEQGLLCSAVLLKDDDLYHLYEEKQEALGKLSGLLSRHDKTWIYDDNHYKLVNYKDIFALVFA